MNIGNPQEMTVLCFAERIRALCGSPAGIEHGALTALGYKPAEFDAILTKLDEKQHVTDLIKQALALLRRK